MNFPQQNSLPLSAPPQRVSPVRSAFAPEEVTAWQRDAIWLVMLAVAVYLGLTAADRWGFLVLLALIPPTVALVLRAPIWAVIAYLGICGSPFYGIVDGIEPGEYVAAGLLVLLLARELVFAPRDRKLWATPLPLLGLFTVFVLGGVVAVLRGNPLLLSVRELFQFLPLTLAIVVMHNLRTQREAILLIAVSAGLTLISLPFEAYQNLMARGLTLQVLTGRLAPEVAQRLPLPHFGAMNAATLASLAGAWLLFPGSRLWKAVGYGVGAAIPLTMLLGQSRVWMLMSILGLVLPALIPHRGSRTARRLLAALGITALTAGLLLLGYAALEVVQPELAYALEARFDTGVPVWYDESISVRMEGAKYLLELVEENPLWGHGFGYEVSLKPYRWALMESSVSGFDNGLIGLLIKFGILGTALVLWLFWFVAKQAYGLLGGRRDKLSLLVSKAFLAGFTCIMLLNLSYSGFNVVDNTNFIGTWSGMILWLCASGPVELRNDPRA